MPSGLCLVTTQGFECHAVDNSAVDLHICSRRQLCLRFSGAKVDLSCDVFALKYLFSRTSVRTRVNVRIFRPTRLQKSVNEIGIVF